jgi:hypothetical protein
MKKNFSVMNMKLYKSKKPDKAKKISAAVKRGLKEYGETFRRLAGS